MYREFWYMIKKDRKKTKSNERNNAIKVWKLNIDHWLKTRNRVIKKKKTKSNERNNAIKVWKLNIDHWLKTRNRVIRLLPTARIFSSRVSIW